MLTALKLVREGVKKPKSLVLSSPGPGMEFLHGSKSFEWKSLKNNADKDGLLAGNFYPWVAGIVYTETNEDYFRSALRDLSGLPPCLVTAGSYEVMLGGIQNLQLALKEANVSVEYREYPKMQHVHLAFFNVMPEAAQGVGDIVSWLKQSWISSQNLL